MFVSEADVYRALLRSNFECFLERSLATLNPGMPFLPNGHIKAIAYQLERIRRGDNHRLIINMPPRHLKSLTVSVAFPAYILGLEPWHRIFVISYGSELAFKHARDSRSVMESSWYAGAFPKMRIARSLEDEVTTSLKGFRKATSVGGALTGLGGNMIIIDDPQKPIDAQSKTRRDSLNQWFSNTLVSRLDNKETGAIIVVTQRVHMDDLSGYLCSGSADWEILSLPAIAEVDERIPIGDSEFYHRRVGEALHPAHESLDTLLKLQQELGTYDFSAQYQQCPIPFGGAMIKRHWLRFDDKAPDRTSKTKFIQSWDIAAKDGLQNDYSVCTTWQVEDNHYHLIDLVRGRYDFPRLRQLAGPSQSATNQRDIDRRCFGGNLARTRIAVDGPLAGETCAGRARQGDQAFCSSGQIRSGAGAFPQARTFLQDLLAELLAFPNGKHDDQVDSITQALAYKFSGYTLDNL